jgi:hypothetical protein
MAQAYSYQYKGKQTTKQDKCKAIMPLDKVRIWLDFNEYCADAKTGEPIYLFSQADIVNDSIGNDVALYEGMEVSVFDYDLDISNKPDAILAEGIIIKNTLTYYPKVKWLIRLIAHKVYHKSKDPFVYWMSDLQ